MIIGVDTGSAHQGVAVLARTPDGPNAFALLAHARVDVEPADVGPAAAATWAIIEAYPGCRVAVEGGVPYGAGGKIVSAAAVALQHAARLGDRVLVRCQDAGVPVVSVVRNTWAFRVVPRDLRGLSSLGRPTVIQDAHVRRALLLYLSPEDVAALASRDERDAAGAAIGVVLAEEDEAAKAAARRVRAEAPRPPRGPRRRVPLTVEDREAEKVARREKRGDVPRKPHTCPKCGQRKSGPGALPHLRGLPCPSHPLH